MANSKISQLTPLESLDGTEVIPVAKGNSNNSITTQQIADRVKNTFAGNVKIIDGSLCLRDTTLSKWRPIWFADGTIQFGAPVDDNGDAYIIQS